MLNVCLVGGGLSCLTRGADWLPHPPEHFFALVHGVCWDLFSLKTSWRLGTLAKLME